MHVLVVTANKGGVGKSTIALQIAAEMARRGQRVLAVDADKQADLTRFAGGAREGYRGLDAVLADPPSSLDPRPFVVPIRPKIDLLGASPRLADVDSVIEQGLGDGPFYLKRALDVVRDEYDWAVIDMGHSDELAGNCVVAADVLLMPTTANFPDANHAGDMLHVAAALRQELRLPKIDLLQRSVISIWRRQHNGAADAHVITKLRERYGELVSPVVLPHSSRVSEANERRRTVREYAAEYATAATRVCTPLSTRTARSRSSSCRRLMCGRPLRYEQALEAMELDGPALSLVAPRQGRRPSRPDIASPLAPTCGRSSGVFICACAQTFDEVGASDAVARAAPDRRISCGFRSPPLEDGS